MHKSACSNNARLRVRIELTADLPIVLADANQLELAVLNLSINARDAMPDGGTLTIETKMSPHPGMISVAVSDTGTGMSPEVMEKIFEPFFTTKDVGKGTGLGLSTVYGIVKQSGGFIFAESKVGKGTSFVIYLPVYREEAATKARRGGKPKQDELWGSGTVLLVEDEDTVRAVAERALTRQGYTVVTAADGDEGLEAIKADSEFDLVVSDVVMPSMDGPAMAKEIRKLAPKMPVLFMSGYAEEQLRREIDIEGMHFIPKPFSVQQIATKVAQVLGAQRTVD